MGIGDIIVDFYSPELKLVIEVDGNSHYENQEHRTADDKRDDDLKILGLHILRFTNLEITENIEGVLLKIKESVNKVKPPLAPPS